MRKRIEIEVLGATGVVGQQSVSQLAGHPWFELEGTVQVKDLAELVAERLRA